MTIGDTQAAGEGGRDPPKWRRRLGAAIARFSDLAQGQLEYQSDRLILWSPVMIGLGIAGYFSLPFEPSLLAFALAFAASIACALVVAPRRPYPGLIIAGVSLLLFGVVVAGARTAMVEAPIVAKRVGPTLVNGTLEEIQIGDKGSRLVITALSVEDLGAAETPEKIRVTVRQVVSGLQPGDRISLLAVLMPPPRPVAPGAYDFGRDLFFKRIGAVGFSVSTPQALDAREGARTALGHRIEAIRFAVSERVRRALPGQTGAVAAALLTGHRQAISEPVLESMRRSGLAHLLAISGLHIGLVSVIIFMVLRLALASVPALALHWPVKKIAACAAVLAALGYLSLTGGTPPTERAFLMICLLYLAVVLDRVALSMRLVAWAATVILVTRPDVILGASFQLSFAAVVALIAVYEGWFRRRARGGGRTVGRTILRYFGGVAATSAIASSATAVFAAYHFQRVALYGVAANMLAVPVTAMVIMPAGLASLLLMPFGLEKLALVPMGWGIALVFWVAEQTGTQPGAVILVPAFATGSLIVATLGGLWLAIWRGRLRYLGIVAIFLGAASVPFYRPPDLLVDEKAELLAVRDSRGALAVSSRRHARFVRENWLRRNGQTDARSWPPPGEAVDEPPLACDALGCVFDHPGAGITAVIRDPRAFAEDCALASVVIALVPARGRCRGPDLVIDRFDLWREGNHAVWFETGSARALSVAAWRGDRPWSLARVRTGSWSRGSSETGR